MSENTETLSGTVINETVEIIPTGRIARMKNLVKSPTFLTAASVCVAAGIVLIVSSREPLPIESEDV